MVPRAGVGRVEEDTMQDNVLLLVAVLLLVPSLVVGFLRFGLRKPPSRISGVGGMLFAAMTFAAAIWIILGKLA